MKIDGYYVQETKTLTFRYANGNDVDLEGNILPNDYVVFIHKKDCEIKQDENGKTYYDSSNAPEIPISYISNKSGVSDFKKKSAINGIEIDGKLVYEYLQATLYFAQDGKVYTTSQRDLIE